MQEETDQMESDCGLQKTGDLRSLSPEAIIGGRTYTDFIGGMCE